MNAEEFKAKTKSFSLRVMRLVESLPNTKPFTRLKRKHLLGCDVPCNQCSIVNRCLAGCAATNYELTGNIALNPPTARYFNIIWDDVSRAIIEHFSRNPSPHFDSRYNTGRKSRPEGSNPACDCDHAWQGT